MPAGDYSCKGLQKAWALLRKNFQSTIRGAMASRRRYKTHLIPLGPDVFTRAASPRLFPANRKKRKRSDRTRHPMPAVRGCCHQVERDVLRLIQMCRCGVRIEALPSAESTEARGRRLAFSPLHSVALHND